MLTVDMQIGLAPGYGLPLPQIPSTQDRIRGLQETNNNLEQSYGEMQDRYGTLRYHYCN